MSALPLVSPEIFDFLHEQGFKPYARLGLMSRAQLGDGVRVFSLRCGEVFGGSNAYRISVLHGALREEATGFRFDTDTTRERLAMTRNSDHRLVAESDCLFLLADSHFLDTLASWEELADHARQSGSHDLLARLTRVKHSVAFRRLPLELVAEAIARMKVWPARAGDEIVRQGEKGDAFYLISAGRAEVWRADIYDDAPRKVAELGPGEAFGEEALVIAGNRNATVRMVEDGELLVLGESDFRDLMAQPLVEHVAPEVAARMFDFGWTPVDVRYAEELEDGYIPGAIHLPLPELRRDAATKLARDGKYITVCLSGKRSAIAALLLKQRGFQTASMKDGMGAWEGEIVQAGPGEPWRNPADSWT